MDKTDFYFLPIPNWDNIKDDELLDLSLVISAINSLHPLKVLTLDLIWRLDRIQRLGFQIDVKLEMKPIRYNGIPVHDAIRTTYKISKTNAINLKVFANSPSPDIDNVETKTVEIEKTFSPKERNSMLLVILGMAIDKYGYDPEANKNPATGSNKNSIKASLERIGVSISDDTIKKYLEEAIKIQQLKK
ncbi:MAG: hypothetical protein RLZZ422_1508 [Pseudomonadota bacterium]|jgi:hypothetical protein